MFFNFKKIAFTLIAIVFTLSGLTFSWMNTPKVQAAGPTTVYGWGRNADGQLGSGSYSPSNVLTPTINFSTPTNVDKIFGNSYVTAFVTDTGEVYVAGTSYSGLIGNTGGYDSTSTPQLKSNLTGITKIAFGEDHAIALKSDGTVWGWGMNSDGQLGDGTYDNPTNPIQIPGLSNIIDIASGGYHSHAVNSSGTVYSWGSNYGTGALGLGLTTNYIINTPQAIPSFSNVVKLAATYDNTFAIKSDGTVWAWGKNDPSFGLPLLDAIPSLDKTGTPVQLTFFSNAQEFRINQMADIYYIKTNVGYYVWGRNADGEAANGNNSVVTTPFLFNAVAGMTDLQVGDYHVMAYNNLNQIYVWGANWRAQAGLGSTSPTRYTSPQLLTISGANEIYPIGVSSYAIVPAPEKSPYPGLTGTTKTQPSTVMVGVPFLGGVFSGILDSDSDPLASGTCSASVNLPTNQTLNGTVTNGVCTITGNFNAPTSTSQISLTLSVTSNSTTEVKLFSFTPEVNTVNSCTFTGSSSTPGQTTTNVCITSGVLTIYAGDNNKNNDICSVSSISNSTVVDTTISNGSAASVTCSTNENSISLTGLTVKSIRQSTTGMIDDIVFEDLRGLSSSTYTVSATVSNFSAGSGKDISLGTNPDNETADSDVDAPTGGDLNKLFATLDPSPGSVTVLRDATTIAQGTNNYQLGSLTTLIDTSTPVTLLNTTSNVRPGRVVIDGVTFKLRVPALVQQGNYTGTIIQTIV